MSRLPAAAWRWLLGVWCGIVAAFLVAPSLVVIPLSFSDRASFRVPPSGWSMRWYSNLLDDPSWLSAIESSLRVGLLSALVATVAGTTAAIALTRSKFRFQKFIHSTLLAPMIAPVIILAIGIYYIYIRVGLLGTTIGFVIAHSVLALPLVLIPVMTSLQGYDRRLDDAAAICGANNFATFRQITLPLIAPGVAAGAIFAFATSFDEVVISLFIQSPYMQTLPVKMYTSVTREIDPTVAAAGTIILVLSTSLVILGTYYNLRRNRVN